MYAHTYFGEPANSKRGEEIEFLFHNEPIRLASTFEQIKKEQELSLN